MNSPVLSFITPLFNHLAETQAMVASLQASLPQGLDYELILVDDGSTDGTRAWLASLDDARVRVHLNPHNLGFARSCNAGVALARGAVIGLLNNDLLFEPGWLEPMLAVLETPALRAGLVGNVQFRVADGALDHAGIRLNLQGQFEHIRALPQGGHPAIEMAAVTGACVLFRRAVFDAVGGLDEQYVNGAEDVDLCFKLRAAGYRIYLAPGSRIRHHVSLSRKEVSGRNERNSRMLFARWRREVKRLLAGAWAKHLQGGAYSGEGEPLLGTLTSDFVATPHAAAFVIAESLLCQHEQRWRQLLDDEAADDDLSTRCHISGLRQDAAQKGYALDEPSQLTVEGLSSAMNFHVCGRALALPAGRQLQLQCCINGIQQLNWMLSPGRPFNVGLPRPLLLNGVPNTFVLKVVVLDAAGVVCGSGGAYVRISNFVIDGQTVAPSRVA